MEFYRFISINQIKLFFSCLQSGMRPVILYDSPKRRSMPVMANKIQPTNNQCGIFCVFKYPIKSTESKRVRERKRKKTIRIILCQKWTFDVLSKQIDEHL